MHPTHGFLLSWAKVSMGLTLFLGLVGSAENWPAWRGPRGDGSSLETALPVHWSTNNRVQWRAALPGAGHASPIVWGESLFTVAAVGDTEERRLLCLDRNTGRIEWQRTVLRSPLERKHGLNSHASSTPATDGEQVYTAFLDRETMVVAAHGLNGESRWVTRPGPFSSIHGFCSSPILFRDLVILNGDHDGDGYLVALDRRDGTERWRVARPNKTRSYCAPAIFEAAGRTQMVLSGSLCVTSYDPANGELLWLIDGPTEQFVASIVYNSSAGLFFVTGGFPDHHVLAIRPDGRGNVTESQVAWHHEEARYAAYVPSPIAVGDYFLVVSDPGYACCFDARTGELQWRERFGSHHASLVSANGLVYFLDDQGVTRVVRPGRTFDLVAENPLGEPCFASPALSEGQLFIRGFENLYCIGTRSSGDE
jgi:outer membrane protein assembly factor BamB